MTNTATKKQWILGILSLLALIGIVVSALVIRLNTHSVSIANSSQTTDFASIMKDTFNQIKFQDEVDKNLLKELKSGAYSFDEPLVVVDPYDQSPLTALSVFTSTEPINLSVHVEGKDKLSDIDFTFDGYNTENIIPIYGLYSNKVNNVTLTSKDKNGKTKQVVLKIKTQPLPKDLSDIAIQTDLPQKEKYQEGLNFTYGINNKKIAFDVSGEYRWYLKDEYSVAANYNLNNKFIFAKTEKKSGDVVFYEINPLGKIFRILYSPYGLHHDIEVFKDNNLLVTGNNGDTVEDFIYEINTQTGKIENTLDLKTVLQSSRKGLNDIERTDWFHNNDITWEKNKDTIIVSGRHQSAVVKMFWPSGKIEWILSVHDNWSPMFEKYLLTPTGPSFEWQYNQHTPQILPDYDNNPNTIDVLLFDNGNQRFRDDLELQRKIKNNEVVEPELYSRIVHYRINEKEKTVEQIWQFGKEWGKKLYTSSMGYANLLANGDRLALFDVKIDSSDATSVKEVSYMEVSENSEIVWQARAMSKKVDGSVQDYRVERMDIYNSDANNLQIGTSVNNLIPREILDEYGIK